MDYERMAQKNTLKLERYQDKVDNLKKHVSNNPKDYQSVIALHVTNSALLTKQREVSVLNYQAQIEKYR